MKLLHLLVGQIVILIVAIPSAMAAENACGPEPTVIDQQAVFQTEKNVLLSRIKFLESRKSIDRELLLHKKVQRIREVADQVRLQRQSTEDFLLFFRWMSTNIAGYNKYIQAGSYAAVLAKALPIPYAGQASVFAKFAVQFTISLNNASMALTNYYDTSQQFLTMADAMATSNNDNEKLLADATIFADRRLLKDVTEARNRLNTVADLSAGTLSFLESVNHYLCGTDEYWNKMKGVFKKDVDPKEKSFLSENINAMRAQAAKFNDRLKSFDDHTQKEITAVKSLSTYDDLLSSLPDSQSTH